SATTFTTTPLAITAGFVWPAKGSGLFTQGRFLFLGEHGFHFCAVGFHHLDPLFTHRLLVDCAGSYTIGAHGSHFFHVFLLDGFELALLLCGNSLQPKGGANQSATTGT